MATSPNPLVVRDYLEALRKANPEIIPNFWMTEEFIRFKGLEHHYDPEHNLSGYKEPGESGWFLPPLNQGYGAQPPWFSLNHEVWAGFVNLVLAHSTQQTVLDRQYIYDPKRFLDLGGGEWKVYRRNIRKYPNRTPGRIEYRKLHPGEQSDAIEQMLLRWGEGRELYDVEVMARFLFEGRLRWGVFHEGRLVGVNVGDENWKHIIFRYCLDDGTPFLNEFLRHQFYVSDYVQKSGKMVNDGGDLDNEGLRQFKLKLNPAEVQTVYSYQKTEFGPVFLPILR